MVYKQQSGSGGFTIVELLIVIVVIGILAAITIVAYSGIQARARDTQMKDAVGKVAQALQILAINQGQTPTMAGSGTTVGVNNGACVNGGGGFSGSGIYSCTLEDMLVSTKLLSANFIPSLPANKAFGNAPGYSIMYYPCGAGSNKLELFYYLENPTADDTSNFNANVATCGISFDVRDLWGMRASKIVTF